MNNRELAELIFNTLSDGYDDEENKEEVVEALEKEMDSAAENSVSLLTVKSALLNLCKRVEELEA